MDGTLLEAGDTLDSVMHGVEGDDFSQAAKVLAQVGSTVAVYDVDPGSEYYVASANTMADTATVRDYAFALYDLEGNVVGGCYYDKATGLAYIPKSLYYNEDGDYEICRIQLQLMQVVGGDCQEAGSGVLASSYGSGDETVDVYESISYIFEPETTAYVEAGLDEDEMTVVINGVPTDDYDYEPSTGEITVDLPSSAIQTLSVTTGVEEEEPELKSSGISTYANTEAAESMQVSLASSVCIELPSWVTTGTAFSGEVKLRYNTDGLAQDGVYVYAYDFSGSNSVSNSDMDRLYQWILDSTYLSGTTSNIVLRTSLLYFGVLFGDSSGKISYDTEISSSYGGNVYAGSSAPTGDDAIVDFSSLGTLRISCGHVTEESYLSWVKTRGINDSADLTENVFIRTLWISEDETEAAFGILCGAGNIGTSSGYAQAGVGLICLNVEFPPSDGGLKIQKSPGSSSDITGDVSGSEYSLAGAQYGVYSDSSCTKSVGTLTTDASGGTDTLELEAGTYYVKETKASPGYDLDTNTYEVTVAADETTTVKSEEPLQYGYIGLTKASGNPSVTSGSSSYSLEGAVYGIYSDPSCTTEVSSMATDSSGSALSGKMALGTYYVKETKASEGYGLDGSVYTVSVTASNTSAAPASVSSSEPPFTGYIELYKASANSSISDGNSCYSLEGAVYGIYSGTFLVGTMVTDASGYAKSGELPLGAYTVKETQASEGYGLDELEYTVVVDGSGTGIKTVSSEEPPLNDPAGITIYKEDAETGEAVPQGEASLEGAQFTVKFYDGYYGEGELAGAEPARTWVLETKYVDGTYMAGLNDTYKVSGDDFYYDGSIPVLPLGTLTIEETRAPEGYTLDGTFKYTDGNGIDRTMGAGDIYYTQITQEGDAAYLEGGNVYTKTDLVCRGGVLVQKRDLETGLAEPEGGATLAGAVFEIVNESGGSVLVDGCYYGPGEVVMAITTDEDGVAQTASDALPFGEYLVIETEAPEGYLLGSNLLDCVIEIPFSIEEDGAVAELNAVGESITDQVKRGDIALTKHNEATQELMSVPFRITSLTTGESHVFWTDVNGDYSSDSTWNLHSYHTDAGETPEDGLWFYGYADSGTAGESDDASLDNDGDGDADGASEDGTGDGDYGISTYSSSEEGADGSGDGASGDGASGSAAKGAEVDDLLGALPYDTYRLDEIPCEANEGFELISDLKFEIYRDVRVVDLGQFYNTPGETDTYLHSQAWAGDTGTQLCCAGDEWVTLYDDCYYYGLEPGTTYYLYGVALDSETREPELDHYGDKICALTAFTPEEADGMEEQEFYFDVEDLSGRKVVFFETIYTLDEDGNAVLVCAEDPEDYENETIYFPDVGTTLLDGDTGSHYSVAEGTVTFVDTVSIKEVPEGTTVRVVGTLMSRDTGEAVADTEGSPVTAETTFVSSGEDEQTVEVVFTFDASALEGSGVVAFESLYEVTDAETGEGPLVGLHEDLEDEDQTITFPELHTTAADAENGTHTASVADGKVTIVDTVDYENVTPGQPLEMVAVLMSGETGEPVYDSDGEPVTDCRTFTPGESSGSLEMAFTFDAADYAGTKTVAFEYLYCEGTVIGSHEDITDEGQTVYIPGVHTNAVDSETLTHVSNADGSVTIIDTVYYEGVPEGGECTVSGVLMDKETGSELIDADGNTVTAEAAFVAEESSGEVELTFTFNGEGLAGKAVVAFEDLFISNELVATHSDLDDEAQTVYLPKIGTTATDASDGDKEVDAGRITINDEVAYKNLVPGLEYRMVATVMDKSTGKAVRGATAEADFTPEGPDGTVSVSISFNASGYSGGELVVFEKAYVKNGEGVYVETASHEDLSDSSQTVTVKQPSTAATRTRVTTGESRAPMYALIIGCAAVAAIVILLVIRRKRRA